MTEAALAEPIVEAAAPAADPHVLTAEELALVFSAMWVAWQLRVGIPVSGQTVMVPDEIGRALDAQRKAERVEAGDDELVSSLAAVLPALEVARRVGYLLEMAGQLITSAGKDTGLFSELNVIPRPDGEKAAEVAKQKRWAEAAQKAVEQARAERVEELSDGSIRIGGAIEIRTSGASNFYVVRIEDNMTLSWHPSEEAARAWVVEHIRDGSIYRDGPYAGST